MAAIKAGLAILAGEVRVRGMRSIAISALGCGLGGLDWKKIQPRIAAAFDGLPEMEVHLYAPWK